jgi:hypothetical protein
MVTIPTGSSVASTAGTSGTYSGVAAIVVAAVVLCGSIAGALAGIEPFATWLYPLAWYPTLVILEAAVASRGGRFFVGRTAFLASALAWSVPFWLFFEILNLRLENWYYVFLPRDAAARWFGIALSFATVIPAVLVVERLLDSLSIAETLRIPRLRLAHGWILPTLGALMLALALAWPRALYPLVWGGVFLVVDPWVLRRAPERSLLGDLERGRPGRIFRLLAAGLAVGLLWEAFNIGARGKWIYTVPGFEGFKLFEMPVAGFLGFPFFALEAFAVWQALVVAGLAAPAEERDAPAVGRSGTSMGGVLAAPARPAAAVATALAAAAFSAVSIAAMHTKTIASLVPTLADLGAPVARLERVGIDDPWQLADADPADLAAQLRTDADSARLWVERSRLAILRGIGADSAWRLGSVGIESVEELAGAEPERLLRQLRAADAPAEPARIRVWVRAARETARRSATRPSS